MPAPLCSCMSTPMGTSDLRASRVRPAHPMQPQALGRGPPGACGHQPDDAPCRRALEAPPAPPSPDRSSASTSWSLVRPKRSPSSHYSGLSTDPQAPLTFVEVWRDAAIWLQLSPPSPWPIFYPNGRSGVMLIHRKALRRSTSQVRSLREWAIRDLSRRGSHGETDVAGVDARRFPR
jgi:hypothetical protein